MASNVIENIFKLSDDEISAYVSNRAIELEIYSDDTPHVLPVIQEGFISSKTEIKTSDSDEVGYCMKGIDYLEFVKYLRREVKDFNEFALVAYTAHYVSNYFDFCISEEEEDKRDQIIFESSKGLKDGELPSINCLRNIKQAVCLEHSVLMQNLLSFLGFNVKNYLMIALVNNEIKGHSVNIIDLVIDNEVKHLFYDMVGMEAYVDGEQEFAGPTVRLISDEEYDNFINGRIPLSIIRRCSKKKGGVDVTFYFPKSLENLQQMKLILNK